MKAISQPPTQAPGTAEKECMIFEKTDHNHVALSINVQSKPTQNLNSHHQAAIPCDKYISL